MRAAADAMEESGPFAVEMILDLEMPESLTSVESTIHGRVDLSEGRSTFEGRSNDGDAWTELVVDGVAYHSRGEIVNAPDWCAVPLSNFDGNALIQTGPLFGDVPDLLRSVSDASVARDRSTTDSTTYRVTVPIEETPSGARVEGNEATLWLDGPVDLLGPSSPFPSPWRCQAIVPLAMLDGFSLTGATQRLKSPRPQTTRSRTSLTAPSSPPFFSSVASASLSPAHTTYDPLAT